MQAGDTEKPLTAEVAKKIRKGRREKLFSASLADFLCGLCGRSF